MNSCQLFGCLKTFFPKLRKSGPCSSSSSNLTCHFELNTIVRKLWNKADTWRLENGGCGRESELQRTDIQRGGASVAAAETEGEIFRMSLLSLPRFGDWALLLAWRHQGSQVASTMQQILANACSETSSNFWRKSHSADFEMKIRVFKIEFQLHFRHFYPS